jgi:arylsulfatase A-like enzyme
VTGNANVNDDFNMHQGFDTYQGTTSLWRDGFKRVPAKILVENWLKATRTVEGKLFGQLVLIDTHGPLPDYPRRRDQLGLSTDEPASRIDRYDAAVLALDDSLRTLDEALTKRGRGDRLFVLVGDHGEGLERPNHHGRGHGRYLYESVLRVPWIIHGPGVAWNHKVQGLSQSVDVAPTIAELAGLPAETSPSPDGSSRAAAVRGDTDQTGERTVFSETFYADEHRARMTTPEWVYIRTFQEGTASSRGIHELYAADDRRQAEDLSDLQPKVAQAFGRELDALRVRVGKDQTIWERPVAEETLQQLEALGYVETEQNTTESPMKEQTETLQRASEEP